MRLHRQQTRYVINSVSQIHVDKFEMQLAGFDFGEVLRLSGMTRMEIGPETFKSDCMEVTPVLL